MSLSRVTCVFFGAASLAALWPQQASACLYDPCSFPIVLVPADGAIFPANATAVLRTSSGQVDVRLREANVPGEEVLSPASPDVPGYLSLLRVSKALNIGGSYELTAAGCGSFVEGGTSTFTVGPAAALPTSLGTLELVRTTRALVHTSSNHNSCGAERPVIAALIKLVPSPEMAPWMDAAAAFSVRVDGAYTSGGPLRSTEGEPVSANGHSFRAPELFDVHVLCDVPAREIDPLNFVRPGKHKVTVRAFLATADERYVESQPLDVELTCPEDSVVDPLEAAPPNADAAVWDGDPEVLANDPLATSATSTRSSQGAPETNGDGCSTRGTSPSAQSNFAALLITALSVLLARGRHRKARSKRA